MKNYRYYAYTVAILFTFSVLVALFGVPYLSKVNGIQVLENEIVSSEQQAKQIALLAESCFNHEIEKDKIAESIQDAIENTESQNIFISVFDWSGKIISHPDITLVASRNEQNTSNTTRNMQTLPTGEELYELVQTNGSSKEVAPEIIYLTPIKNSDWIIAAHLNSENVINQINKSKNQTYLVFSIILLFIMLIVLAMVRLVTGYYENQLSLKNSKLEDGVLNLAKLNTSLENYQKKLGELTSFQSNETAPVETVKEKEKQRILTYVRNELMPVNTEDIGYIYVDNTITYVVQKDGKRSTTSESLDQIYSYLDEKSFFRANRQIIVAISAIEKIIKFGNSKLKIQVNPPSEIDIIIGKNKAAAFKQWLDL